NGSLARMEKLATALERAGYKYYSLIRLRKLRDTTHAFLVPHDIRISGLPWSYHEVARDLDTLRAAQRDWQEQVKKRPSEKFTRDFIIKFRKRRRRERATKGREHPKLHGKAKIVFERDNAKIKFLTNLNDATEAIDFGLRAISQHAYDFDDRAEMQAAWNRFERHIIDANPQLD